MSKAIYLNEKFLILILLCVATALSLPLITRSFIYDELHLATHYVLNPHFWAAMKNDEPMKNHLGYTVLAYCFYQVLGRAEWVFRLPALLFGLANIFVFWYFTRKIFGAGFAMMAAALMAFVPASIIWNASARGYSALVFFSFFSTFLYFNLLEKPGKKNFWALTAANVIGLSFHFFFIFIILTQVLHVLALFCLRDRRSLGAPFKALSLTAFLSALIYIPLFISTYHGFVKGHLVPNFPLIMLGELLDIKFNWMGFGVGGLVLTGWVFFIHKLTWPRLLIRAINT